jgi:hypothetical protein
MVSSGLLRRVALTRTTQKTPFFNVVPSSPILFTLIVKALSSSETAVLTRAKRRNVPEDAFFKFHVPLNPSRAALPTVTSKRHHNSALPIL